MLTGEFTDQKVAGASSPLTKEDGASTVPQTIHGDWVLFHPVYTTAEVKSVEGMSAYSCALPSSVWLN